MTFVVVGRPAEDDTDRMQPELVVCPYCETMRRVILPFDVGPPISRTVRVDSQEPYRRGWGLARRAATDAAHRSGQIDSWLFDISWWVARRRAWRPLIA